MSDERQDVPKGLTLHLSDYIELVDLTGRCIVAGKSGYIDERQQPILECLNIPADNWITLTSAFESRFNGAVGSQHHLQRTKAPQTFHQIPGMNQAKKSQNTA